MIFGATEIFSLNLLLCLDVVGWSSNL